LAPKENLFKYTFSPCEFRPLLRKLHADRKTGIKKSAGLNFGEALILGFMFRGK
jgi:hypothetical protein